MESVRIHIPNELFAPAESSHFEGEIDLPVLKAGPDLYTIDAPVAWQMDITNTGDAFLVTGTAEAVARTMCARCLEEVAIEAYGEIEGYFLIGGDSEAPEDMDEDEYERLPEDGDIDVAPLVVAALLLELPLQPLCEDDCAGLCPSCGANRNDGDCGCAPSADDEEFELARNPFAALRNVDFGFDAGEEG